MKKFSVFPWGICMVCIAISTTITSCSKGGDDPGTTDPCAGKNITLTSTNTNSNDLCSPNGSIQATASGSSGFTYSLNNGTFQNGSTFNNVASGTHSLTVKDNAGCSRTISVTIGSGNAGPLFAAVKAVVQANCAVPNCHSGGAPTGNINFTAECNIVAQSARIKVRAVDQAGTAGQMPLPPLAALSQADRDKITQWIAAGGKYSD